MICFFLSFFWYVFSRFCFGGFSLSCLILFGFCLEFCCFSFGFILGTVFCFVFCFYFGGLVALFCFKHKIVHNYSSNWNSLCLESSREINRIIYSIFCIKSVISSALKWFIGNPGFWYFFWKCPDILEKKWDKGTGSKNISKEENRHYRWMVYILPWPIWRKKLMLFWKKLWTAQQFNPDSLWMSSAALPADRL